MEKIYLGSECEKFLSDCNITNSVDLTNFRKNCLKFYQNVTKEIQQRLPLTDTLFEQMRFINPSDLLCLTSPDHVNIGKLINMFRPEEVEVELRNLKYPFDENEVQKISQLEPSEFWKIIANEKSLNNDFLFKNVIQLAHLVMILPHSNAEAQRIFSIMNDVKSKKRNKLGSESLNAICMLRSKLHNDNIKSHNYVVTDNHLKLLKSSNIYK